MESLTRRCGVTPQQTHFAQWRADGDACGGRRRRNAGWRNCAGRSLGIVRRDVQQAFVGIPERAREVVVHDAAGEACAAAAPGSESVGVGAEALRVGALELDGEVSRPAVVLGIEAVGLAAGGAADLDHLYSHA